MFIQSDGTPWRPLVHIEDISRAFLTVLEAPRELVHNQAFNIGSSEENYQIRDVADIVREVVPGCTVKYMEGGGPDPRCYRVDCSKFWKTFPGFKTEWTVRRGAQEMYDSFVRHGLTKEQFAGSQAHQAHSGAHGRGPARRVAALADGGKRSLKSKCGP